MGIASARMGASHADRALGEAALGRGVSCNPSGRGAGQNKSGATAEPSGTAAHQDPPWQDRLARPARVYALDFAPFHTDAQLERPSSSPVRQRILSDRKSVV